MVALNPQFTVLAAFCSLAAMSAVDGAAIQARYPNSASMSSSSPAKKPTRVPTPVAPLPSGASAASSSGSASASAATPSASSHADGKKSKKGDKQHKQRMFSPADAAVRLGEMINHGQKSEKRDGLDLDMLNNNVQAHLYARRHDKVAVKGNDYAHMRRRHHHDYNHDPKRDVVSDGANMHKRSSVVIPNSHGSSYIVSHSRRNHGLNVAEARAYLGRRDQGGVQGTIDIMSPSSGTPNGKKIASLYLDPSISNTTDWVLNASETNQTKLYLITAASIESTSSTSDETPVNLQMPVFDSSRTALVEYCATFDPSPSQPEPLTVEPCFNPSNPSTPHKSQVFTYNEFSGVVRPMWFAGEDDGTTGNMTEPASSSASTTDDDSDDDGDDIPATPSGAGVANIARDAAQSPQQAPAPQNVTLVFHPEEPEVGPSQSVDDVDPTSTSVVTVTTVDTVTATVTATATSSAVVSSISASASAMDDGDAGLSSLAMSSASVSASAFSSGSVSASSAAATSSVLNVEVVGAIASTSAPAPTSGSASASASGSMSAVITSTATDSASASASTTGTSSVDAEAIASDIAGSDSDSSASASTTASSYSGSASASGTPVSTTASASGSAAAMDAGASTSSPVSSAASSTMTAVSTAPYQWMFKSERL